MAFLTCDFFASQLGMDIPMNVLLPEKRQEKPVLRPDAKYKVLYLLHGHSDDASSYIRKSVIELLVRRYDLAVVMPEAHRSGYGNSAHGHAYYDYILEDVMVQAPNFFPISTAPEDTYIAGLSMGGMGAMRIALNNPRRFAGVGCLSAGIHKKGIGSKMFTSEDFARNASRTADSTPSRDLEALLRELDKAGGLPNVKFFHECGTDDPLYPGYCALRDVFHSLKGQWNYRCEERPGNHNWDNWNYYLPRMLQYFGLIPEGDETDNRKVLF